MKKNLEQFRAEKKKLEESDNLIKARYIIVTLLLIFWWLIYKHFRQKLNTIESETFKVTQQAKNVVNVVMTSVKKKVNQASESDLAKKAGIIFMNIIYLNVFEYLNYCKLRTIKWKYKQISTRKWH